jgi:inner membrane protein
VDSLTQMALGSAVGLAVMGRHTRPWKAALWGAVCGTLPDLDTFIDHGDPVSNMTLHRAESHAFFYLTLASPAIAWGAARLHGELDRFRRWWLAVWLALVTHPMLDAMTIYGTQLLRPFSDHPFGVGSIFIIDPLYTVPLLVAVIVALRSTRPRRASLVGLALATAYLGWSVLAQQHVHDLARRELARQGIAAQAVLVQPTAFNTVLWRVLAMEEDRYHEGFHSLLDSDRRIDFDAFVRAPALYAALESHWPVARIAWFSHGFFRLRERPDGVDISDLRMGQEPFYLFTFRVAERRDGALVPVPPEQRSFALDAPTAFDWLWRRLRGERVPPPRERLLE